MSASTSTFIVFVCICAGIALGAALPGQRMDGDTKDVIKLGTGLIATLAALVLGLLVGTAKQSYDSKIGQVRQLTADLILLDQLLAQYGPDAHDARLALRQAVPPLIDKIWRENNNGNVPASTFHMSAAGANFYAIVQRLSPKTDAQRSIQARAVQFSTDLAQTRLLLFEQSGNPVPLPFLAVLVFWLVVLFCSFGLFAKPNATIIAALLVCALSACAAIYLILELSDPFVGLIQISSEPLRQALAPM